MSFLTLLDVLEDEGVDIAEAVQLQMDKQCLSI